MRPTKRTTARPPDLSRRNLLRTALFGAGALAVGPAFLAACGDDDDAGGTSTPGSGSGPAGTTGSTGATGTTAVAGTGAAGLIPTTPAAVVDAERAVRRQLPRRRSWLLRGRGPRHHASGSGGPNVAGDAQTVSGAVLMNISGGDGVARSNIEGAGLTIVGMQYQKSPGTLLSLAEKNIATPERSIGTRIAVAGTDTPALDAFLRTTTSTKSQVELIPSQYDPAVLTADQADSIFCFYNDLPVALERAGASPYNDDAARRLRVQPGIAGVHRAHRARSTGDTRDQVMHLLRAEIRGWQDYKTDYARRAQLAVDMYPDAGLDLETQKVTAEVQPRPDVQRRDRRRSGSPGSPTRRSTSNIALFAELGIEGADAVAVRPLAARGDLRRRADHLSRTPERMAVPSARGSARSTAPPRSPAPAVTKTFDGAPDALVAFDDDRPDPVAGDGHGPRRSVRLRQVDAPAHHRRARDGRRPASVAVDGASTRPSCATTGEIAVAFQDASLLPWRSVAIERRRWRSSSLAVRVDDAHVRRAHHRRRSPGFEDVKPAELSGGMRQRAAIARCLVTSTTAAAARRALRRRRRAHAPSTQPRASPDLAGPAAAPRCS